MFVVLTNDLELEIRSINRLMCNILHSSQLSAPTNLSSLSPLRLPSWNMNYSNLQLHSAMARLDAATVPDILTSSTIAESENPFHFRYPNANASITGVLPSKNHIFPDVFNILNRCRHGKLEPPLYFKNDILRWRHYGLSSPELLIHHNTMHRPTVKLPSFSEHDVDLGNTINASSAIGQDHRQANQALWNEILKVNAKRNIKQPKFEIESSTDKINTESVVSSEIIKNSSVVTSQELYGATFHPSTNIHNFGLCLYMIHHDEINLSPYQCLLRMQVEYFEAGPNDVQSIIQG
jgi:hypothetical protein